MRLTCRTLWIAGLTLSLSLASVGCSDRDDFEDAVSEEPLLEARYPPSRSDWESALQHYDPGRLLVALDSIRDWHSANRTGLSLNPGVDADALADRLDEFPCQVPTELRSLWGWSNGESTDRFVWYHRFLSVSDSVDEYNRLLREPYYDWNSSWIPVLEFQEEWYFVECSDQLVAASPVSKYFIETGPSHNYTNLTALFETMAAAMERQAVSWEEDWWGRDDVSALSDIHAEFNDSGHFPYAVD